MVYKLLTAFIISICLFFSAAGTQSAFADFRKSNTGFLHYFKTVLISRQSTTTQVNGTQVSNIPSPTPTIFTAMATGKPSPTPTKKPAVVTPLPTLQKGTTSAPTPVAPVSSDAMSFIMSEINKYRASQGLASVQTSAETCNFAAVRAAEIVTSFNHDGFQNRITSKTLPYASWSNVTENIAMTSNYQDVVNMWINSPGHAANMRSDTTYVCVRQNGNYFAYEGMRL